MKATNENIITTESIDKPKYFPVGHERYVDPILFEDGDYKDYEDYESRIELAVERAFAKLEAQRAKKHRNGTNGTPKK